MADLHNIDSDRHNFNRSSYIKNRYVLKPRPLFAEYRVYSKKSEFRAFIEKISKGSLKLLPYFDFKNYDPYPSTKYQKMSYLSLKNPTKKLLDREILSIGGILALMNVLGVTDLHKTNVLFGQNKNNLYFAPIDLEVFGQQFNALNMGFLPSSLEHDTCCAGTAQLAQYLARFPDPDFSAKLISGYETHLALYLKNKAQLIKLFFKDYKKELLITRVVLRPTLDYYQAISNKKYDGFLPEEIIQMKRKDIPYFFSFLNNKNELFYWSSPEAYKRVKSKVSINSRKFGTTPRLSHKELSQSFYNIASVFDSHLGVPSCITTYKEHMVIHKSNFKMVITENNKYKIKRYLHEATK